MAELASRREETDGRCYWARQLAAMVGVAEHVSLDSYTCLVRETVVGARDGAHRSAQMQMGWTGPSCPGSRSPRRGHKSSQRFGNGLVWKGRGGRPLRLRHR